MKMIIDRIRITEAEISELSTAIARMNARVTPETEATIKVANDVFGGTLRNLKGQLFDLKTEKAKIEASNKLNSIMREMSDEIDRENRAV